MSLKTVRQMLMNQISLYEYLHNPGATAADMVDMARVALAALDSLDSEAMNSEYAKDAFEAGYYEGFKSPCFEQDMIDEDFVRWVKSTTKKPEN